MAIKDPLTSWCSDSCVTSSPQEQVDLCDLLLVNGIWHKWWDITYEIRLWSDRLLGCDLRSLTLDGASCHVLRQSSEEVHVLRNWGGPLAMRNWDAESNSLWGTETHQPPCEYTWRHTFSKSSVQLRLQPWATSERHPAKPNPDSRSAETVR